MGSYRPIVSVRNISDGDASHVPYPEDGLSREPPTDDWLVKLGQDYDRGNPKGAKLNALPHSYTTWSKTRSSGHVDRYIYGHPNHRRFRSTVDFKNHLHYLRDYNTPGFNNRCTCEPCQLGLARPRTMTATNASNSSAAASASTPLASTQQNVAESAPQALPTLPPPPPPPRSSVPLPEWAPHGPHYYSAADPEGPTPGYHCMWCPPYPAMNYCGICNRMFEAPDVDNSLPWRVAGGD